MAKKKEEQLDTKTAKEAALKLAMDSINKANGSGTVKRGGESVPGVNFMTSGSVKIDQVLGGGWAQGRIIEIFGPESSGKTTLTLHAIAEVQKAGGVAAFIDAEHALDPAYASALGVNMEELIIAQPDSGEQALQVAETLAKSGAVSLIVIDSVAALTPQAELEGEVGDSHMGRQARLMGQFFRMTGALAHKTNTTLMFINQLRMKLGIMFGNPETTPGGNALKFYASQRIDVRRVKGEKDGADYVANVTRVKCVKNKVAPPFKECEVLIRYGQGIDVINDLVDLAVEANVVQQSGSWFSFGDNKIGQGKKQVIALLEKDSDLREQIQEQLNAAS